MKGGGGPLRRSARLRALKRWLVVYAVYFGVCFSFEAVTSARFGLIPGSALYSAASGDAASKEATRRFAARRAMESWPPYVVYLSFVWCAAIAAAPVSGIIALRAAWSGILELPFPLGCLLDSATLGAMVFGLAASLGFYLVLLPHVVVLTAAGGGPI